MHIGACSRVRCSGIWMRLLPIGLSPQCAVRPTFLMLSVQPVEGQVYGAAAAHHAPDGTGAGQHAMARPPVHLYAACRQGACLLGTKPGRSVSSRHGAGHVQWCCTSTPLWDQQLYILEKYCFLRVQAQPPSAAGQYAGATCAPRWSSRRHKSTCSTVSDIDCFLIIHVSHSEWSVETRMDRACMGHMNVCCSW